MELRHVVAATDSSAAGHHAVLAAARLAERVGARLTVLTVRPAAQAGAERIGAPVAARRSVPGASAPSWARWRPGPRRRSRCSPVCRASRFRATPRSTAGDLLVLGHKHRTQRQRMFLGDTADAVARRSQVPCLFVGPESGRAGPDAGVPRRHRTQPDCLPGGIGLRAGDGHRGCAQSPSSRSGSTSRTTSRAALPASRTLRLNRSLGQEMVPADLRIRRGNVLTELLAEASDTGARLLAFGYHRGGPPGIVEGGSVARGLLHSALCAVLTVPL